MIEGAACSRDESPASTTCTRCGDFLCASCVKRVDTSPLPYCEDCLERRTDHLKGRKLGFLNRNKPARVSVAFGVLSICVTILPFFLIGFPMAIWGFVEARKLRGEGLATAVVGLLLSIGHGLIWGLAVLPSYLDSFFGW